MSQSHESLEHYSSKYYDPAKAREYYLRTRELKGRPNAGALKTEEAKNAWNYSKGEIQKAKDTEFKSEREKVQKEILQLRETAVEKQKAITEKLKQLFDNIRQQQTDRKNSLAEAKAKEIEKIRSRIQDEISSVPPVPRGLSRADTARLSDIRRAEIAKIRNTGSSEIQKLDEKFKFESDTSRIQSEKTSASEEVKKLVSDLKDNIEKAKKNYEDIKTQLKAKYEAEYTNEFNAIDASLNSKPSKKVNKKG